jgi:hypothetical protein
LINSKLTLEPTSNQGALSGSKMKKNVAYTIKVTMKEGKWDRIKPIINDFYVSACVFMFGERHYMYNHYIREVKREPTAYHTWKDITVRISHDFDNQADADRFIERLKDDS